eukprot:6180983-Pleurochrysis_carterae.AAC.1
MLRRSARACNSVRLFPRHDEGGIAMLARLPSVSAHASLLDWRARRDCRLGGSGSTAALRPRAWPQLTLALACAWAQIGTSAWGEAETAEWLSSGRAQAIATALGPQARDTRTAQH